MMVLRQAGDCTTGTKLTDPLTCRLLRVSSGPCPSVGNSGGLSSLSATGNETGSSSVLTHRSIHSNAVLAAASAPHGPVGSAGVPSESMGLDPALGSLADPCVTCTAILGRVRVAWNTTPAAPAWHPSNVVGMSSLGYGRRTASMHACMAMAASVHAWLRQQCSQADLGLYVCKCLHQQTCTHARIKGVPQCARCFIIPQTHTKNYIWEVIIQYCELQHELQHAV